MAKNHRTRCKPGPKVTLTCAVCHKSFTVPHSRARDGQTYCSRGCCRKGRTRPPAERFWRHVRKTDGCWLWTGFRNMNGYGRFGITSRQIESAHRVAWELTHGEIPDGLWVLHRCDNPPCVNPAHLFLGDRAANNKDMIAKARHNLGRKNGNAKLTEDAVRVIRARFAAGEKALGRLADEFGVSKSVICNIVNGKTWKHVT